MLFAMHSPETLYAALVARDPAFDGHAYVCVTTTGVFCRLTCPARKPKFENVRFFDSIGACLAAGFRPCLRCRPLDAARTREPLVGTLLDRLECEPDRNWTEDDLAAIGLDPSTVRRAFKRHLGTTFLDLARLRRTGRGMDRLAAGGAVIDAQLDGGFESGSGFRESVIRLLGDSPNALKDRALLKADWIDTPIGTMLAVADTTRLHLLEFFDRKALPAELIRIRERTSSAITFGRLPPIASIDAELRAYFVGQRTSFATPLAVDASQFTRTVWERLLAIPFGTTTTYGDIATAIGRPSAPRAVARANGANRIAIVIPCHRVIGMDGALTGYGGGLWRKRWLIEHERKTLSLSAAGSQTAPPPLVPPHRADSPR